MRCVAWCDCHQKQLRSCEERKGGSGAGLRLLSSSAQLGILSPGSRNASAEEASSQLYGFWAPVSQDVTPLGNCPTSELCTSWAPVSQDALPLGRCSISKLCGPWAPVSQDALLLGYLLPSGMCGFWASVFLGSILYLMWYSLCNIYIHFKFYIQWRCFNKMHIFHRESAQVSADLQEVPHAGQAYNKCIKSL